MTRYRLDPNQSRFLVHVFAEGLFSFMGHNPTIAIRGFGGDVQFVDEAIEKASLLVLVQTSSLAVVSEASAKDRAEIEKTTREQVLEVDKYPEAVYQSTEVSGWAAGAGSYHVKIAGKLTLHGVTRDCPVSAELTRDENHLKARGQLSLKQSDYRIKPVSVAAGTLKVKDEVKISFEIGGQRV